MKKEFFIIAIVIVFFIGLYSNRKKIRKFMTRGYRNNNPGNIVLTGGKKWVGEINGKDPRFKTFKNMAYGYRAMFVTLNSYIKNGFNTIEKIVNRYAPSHENPTKDYANFVANRVGIPMNMEISKGDYTNIRKIISALSRFENGIEPNEQEIKDGFNLWIKSI